MTDFARLGIRVDSQPVSRARDELGRFVRAGRSASEAANRLEHSTGRARDEFGRFVKGGNAAAAAAAGLSSSLRRAVGQMAAFIGVAQGARAVGGAAEAYTKMTNSLRAMGVEAGQVAGTMQTIADVANRTRAPLEATAQLYQRISIAGRDLGASQSQVLRFTENVGLALAQTGTSSQEASGALLQLSQAMAGGTVRAEEFNSILEGAFPIAQAAANAIDGAAGSVGKLRQMVVEGEISSREFFEAILSQTDALEQAFANTVPTIGQAFGVLGNNLTMFIGQMDSATGASGAIAEAVLLVANNLNTVSGVAVAAGVAVATAYAPAIWGAVKATGAWIASLVTLRGALIATGVGALVVGAGVLIGKFLDLVNATGGWGDALHLLGEVASGVWEGIKTSASAIPVALGAVWELIKSDFLYLMSELSAGWRDFLISVGASGDAADAAVTKYLELSNDAAVQSGKLADAAKNLATGGFDKAAEAAAKLRTQVDGTTTSTDSGADAADELAKALAKLEKGGKKAGKGLDKAKTEAEAFAEALKEAADTAEELGTKKAGIIVGGIDSMSDAWGDFVARGFRDFKGFADSVLDSFTGMLSQMIALAARNKILIGLGLGGSVVGSTASAGGLGGGGGLLNILSGGSTLTKLAGAVPGIASGLGGILSGGGLGASFANLGGLVSGSSGFAAGALGAALPALGIIAGGIAVLSKAFSRKYRGSGLDARLSSEGLEGGRLFDFYKGGFFRSDKWVHKALPQELAEALDSSMKGAAQTVLDLSAALDLSTEGLKDMEGVAFSIWTNGKSQEEIQRLLEDQVTRTANEMAKLILTEEEYVRASETHLEALQRLGTSLLAANDALDLLSHTLFDVSAAGGDAASGLVDAFGGADAMTAAVNAYFAAFYTAEEQAEALRRRALERLGEQFDDLGLSLPRSRAEFRALVESVDLTSEAGRELYAQLLSLSGAMDQVLPKVSAYTEVMQGIVDQIGGEIGVQIGAARDMARITEQSAQLWYRTATTLRDFLSDLLNTDLTAASRSQTLAVNRSRFETAFDMARGGDVEAARDIPELAKAYLNSARANASTSLEYRRIAAAVQGQVNFLAGLAELEGANEDVLRGLYEQQIEVLTGLGQFLQLEGLTDEQVGQLSDGVAALAKDWDGTVEAFENSLGALEEAIRTAEAFSYDDLVGSLDVAVSLADNAPAWVQRLVDRADTGIRTSLDFIIRRDDLTPADRWIATNAASEHVAALDFVLRNDLDRQTRRLVLQTAGQLNRDLSLTLMKDLDADTREMLLTRNQNLSRRVTVALTKEGGKTIKALDRLRDLIGTNGNGKITFDGGLKLTSDQAFKGLSEGVQDLLSPINKLRMMMEELRVAVDEDRQQREDALIIAGLQTKGANAVARTQQAQAVVDQFNALRGQYGIGLVGQDGTVSVNEKGRIETSFDYYSGGDVVGFKNALKKAFGTDSIGRVFAANNDRIGNAEDRAERLREQVRDLGGIPAFANGGTHRGGLARVGENDIELVAPSRIYNPRETKAMLDNRDVVAELRGLRREVAELRDDNQQLMLANIKHSKRIADVQTRIQRDPGSLTVRVAE